MSDADDIDATAGEYVLGTLDASERAAVAARRSREPALDRAIMAWEQRLAPLTDAVPSLAPPPDMFARIERRLDRPTDRARGHGSAGDGSSANVVALERRMRTWRGAALAAGSLAACLAVTIGVREATRAQPNNLVAVFVQDDVAPSFLLSVDFKTQTLTVKAVSAKPQPDRSYQLWIVHERLGGAPQSLGLIEIDAAGTSRRTVTFDPALLTTATFGISLEPPGGSPTGRPTGPALHSRLLPASL